MRLAWDAPATGAVAGYRVYYGTASGSYQQPRGSGVGVGTDTDVTVGGLTQGRTYYFVVTSFDSNGVESGYSNEASTFVQ